MNIIKTYHVPVPARINHEVYTNEPAFLAVLTKGQADDYAVYIGMGILPDPDFPEYEHRRKDLADWVAANGLKQNYQQAITYFPDLFEQDYRR